MKKILVVSVFSNHFFNWILQLENANFKVYWLDINDSNTIVNKISFVEQTVSWKRKFDYPGRQWIKKNLPLLNNGINKFNKRDFLKVLQKKMAEIKPDIIHSFEMHSACVPILEIMKSNPQIRWIYSAWGNDLFYFQNDMEKAERIKRVMQRLDFMFADCTRDFEIAKELGFKGEYLGTFPGGGGYDLEHTAAFRKPLDERAVILIKGYEHAFGRCISVLNALLQIQDKISHFRIIVFAANQKVQNHVLNSDLKKFKNLEMRGPVGREELMKLMGESLIYVGNSISDGMPNTLLESIVMGAFPIQSNPGGATGEIIIDGVNGFLIEEPENSEEIARQIEKAIMNPELLRKGIDYNNKSVRPLLERNHILKQVVNKYKSVVEE